jgi:hypothetical protein
LFTDAFWTVHNWRTSHAFPLNTFQIGLRQRARKIEGTALVAQRLKRFSSVMSKLSRETDMKLSQMQDLGGCRAIMSNVNAVQAVYERYRGTPTLFGEEGALRCFDYITEPKVDGYRGIHVVGRYRARWSNQEDWNGHRIEIQLRSRLQHAFATTVETVTTFTRTPLKFGGGPTEWRRFFSLMGSALALREGTPPVPKTPTGEAALRAELRESSKALRVKQRLLGWTSALQTLPRKNTRNFNWLLLVLDTTANTINVTGYSDRMKASAAVAELERTKRADLDAVLVWVRSAKDLRRAYPNYYADTRAFLNALDKALRG